MITSCIMRAREFHPPNEQWDQKGEGGGGKHYDTIQGISLMLGVDVLIVQRNLNMWSTAEHITPRWHSSRELCSLHMQSFAQWTVMNPTPWSDMRLWCLWKWLERHLLRWLLMVTSSTTITKRGLYIFYVCPLTKCRQSFRQMKQRHYTTCLKMALKTKRLGVGVLKNSDCCSVQGLNMKSTSSWKQNSCLTLAVLSKTDMCQIVWL